MARRPSPEQLRPGGFNMKSVLLLSSAVAALAFTVGAHAATAAAADQTAAAGDAATALPELVVVAEKREQNLQKVPVAVSVFNGAERDRIGINSVQEVTNFAPGFAYDPGNTHAYIRGVGRQSINLSNDARVATYEDGFYVVSPYQLDKSSLFLSQEQIERGPQNVGGRNADGGSIDMISVRPTDTPYGEIRATAGNFGHYEIEGAVSGQIAPGLDVRLAAYDNQQTQGYFKNLDGPPSEGGQINEWYVEGQLDWKPNDNAELWMRAFASSWDNRGDAGARTGFESGHWDETNLTDPNQYPGAGLFVNPNFGFASVPGSAAQAAAAGANTIAPGVAPGFLVGSPYVPVAGSLRLANTGVTDNPALKNVYNIADLEPRTVTLGQYNDVNYVFTYRLPANIEFKYVGGFQGYNYGLNYSEPDTSVESYTMPVLSPGVSPLVLNPLVNLNYKQDDWWTSHEFSLQSDDDQSKLQWIAGFYFYREQYTNPISATAPDQPQLTHPILSLTTFAPAAANLTNTLFYQNYNLTDTSLAGYGQVAYKVTDDVTVTGNLRFTSDNKEGYELDRDVAFNNQIIDALAPFLGAGTPSLDSTLALTCPTGNPKSCYSGTALAKGVSYAGVVGADGIEQRGLNGSSSAWTGGAGIDWTPNPNTFLYARYSRGYEDFSFNAGYISANPEVAPEFINSYEVGYKQAIGRTLMIDTAAFYYDYNDLQVPISVINGGLVQSTFINAPKAVSEGVEIEGDWTPVHNLLVTLSYSYDHTAINTGCSLDTSGAPTASSLCVVDTNDPNAVAPGANPAPGQPAGAARLQSVKGNPLPNAPANKLAIDVAYTFNFEPGDLTLSASYAWRDVQDGTIFNRTYDNAPSWNNVDLRALWKSKGDKYEIIGFVKNVFNNLEYEAADEGAGLLGTTGAYTSNAAGLFETNVYNLAPPRTYGVEVRYKFF
jgi:iron complex outermembrane receptor protein